MTVLSFNELRRGSIAASCRYLRYYASSSDLSYIRGHSKYCHRLYIWCYRRRAMPEAQYPIPMKEGRKSLIPSQRLPCRHDAILLTSRYAEWQISRARKLGKGKWDQDSKAGKEIQERVDHVCASVKSDKR